MTFGQRKRGKNEEEGGYIYAKGTSNDAIDANRNLVVNGGVVLASGGAQPQPA